MLIEKFIDNPRHIEIQVIGSKSPLFSLSALQGPTFPFLSAATFLTILLYAIR